MYLEIFGGGVALSVFEHEFKRMSDVVANIANNFFIWDCL
jgi:hypothetical protein